MKTEDGWEAKPIPVPDDAPEFDNSGRYFAGDANVCLQRRSAHFTRRNIFSLFQPKVLDNRPRRRSVKVAES